MWNLKKTLKIGRTRIDRELIRFSKSGSGSLFLVFCISSSYLHHFHFRFLQEKGSHWKSSLFSITLEQHITSGDIIQLVENDIPDKHMISSIHFVHLASEFHVKQHL